MGGLGPPKSSTARESPFQKGGLHSSQKAVPFLLLSSLSLFPCSTYIEYRKASSPSLSSSTSLFSACVAGASPSLLPTDLDIHHQPSPPPLSSLCACQEKAPRVQQAVFSLFLSLSLVCTLLCIVPFDSSSSSWWGCVLGWKEEGGEREGKFSFSRPNCLGRRRKTWKSPVCLGAMLFVLSTSPHPPRMYDRDSFEDRFLSLLVKLTQGLST